MRWYTNVKELGNYLYVRGYENGKSFKDKIEYRPTLYVKSKIKTEYKTLDNFYVAPIQPGSIKDTKEYIKKYKDVEQFDIYGNSSSVYQYISEKYPETNIEFDIKKINLITIDIECASENGFPDPKSCDEEILLITIQNNSTKQIITWGSRPFTQKLDNYKYICCNSEQHLLASFLDYWSNNYPEIITGYNCEFYDIPYIVGRMMRILGEKETRRLSPWNYIREKETEIRKGEYQSTYEIYGVSTLDFYDLYKKYSFKNPENYRLDTVAFNELGERKLDHEEYETFKDFYTNGWDTFVLYNKIDVELVDKLEDKTGLIQLAITMAYTSKTNYEDVFYQVRMWDTIIYNYLLKKKIVVPPKQEVIEKSDKFVGAYVKEPIPGVYNWVVSMDLTSLYPHIMMNFNISPETLIDEHFHGISIDKVLSKSVDFSNTKPYSFCPNGSMYRRDIRGFLPELLDTMFKQRKSYKDQMLQLKKQYETNPSKNLEKQISKYSVLEQSIKVCLNSCYGATGNPYFRFYDLRNAEAVTYSGQLAIKWIERKLNEYLNTLMKTQNVDYIIYCDTDSAFLNMDPLVNLIFAGKNPSKEKIVDFLDKVFSQKIDQYVDSSYRELSTYLNAYEHRLHMKREKIADRAIWTAKKRYIINVWDNEGIRYSEPDLKITGIEAIKSSTPAFCRSKIKEALKLIMTSDEETLIKFISDTKKQFFQLSVEEVSFPKSVNDVNKFKVGKSNYIKGTPIHVKGSILYNYLIQKNNLDKKYSLIKNGEKIKFCYLKLPNPTQENVISFIQKFPKELDINKYVDYDTQFEKTFVKPLKAILDIIGWKVEKVGTLTSFFIKK